MEKVKVPSVMLPLNEMLSELHDNVLSYWMNKMVDHEHGGFYGRRDGHDVLEEKAPKGVILNTRILWTFSCAARTFRKQQYLDIAHRAYDYLVNCFIDAKHGGVYWMVDYEGQPLHTKKQVYAQAFAIYALVEYYLASENTQSIEEAKKLFRLVEQHSFDKVENGYMEAFDQQWNPLDDLRLSEKDANEKKTMNTHLHVLEAYTLLHDVWKDSTLGTQLRNLIFLFKEKIINDNYRYDLFFNEHWELQSSHTSFGHDIEGSWLLCEAARSLGDANLISEVQSLAVLTTKRTIVDGLDEDGGLMNETERAHIIDSDKHWWPQAEALVGLVNAWQITGDNFYLNKAQQVWAFIKTYMIDRKNGEWHWLVSRDREINYNEDKAGPWKCPYHNGRALIEVLRRLTTH